MPTPVLRSGLAIVLVGLLGALIVGASGAADPARPSLDGATAEVSDAATFAPIMLKLRGQPAAAAFAEAKSRGASPAEAAEAGRAQKAQNDSAQRGVLNALSRAGSPEVLYRVQSAYNGIAVQAPLSSMEELARLPGVEEVIQIPLHTPSNASSMRLIGAPGAWEAFDKTGDGVTIGIIDSGIDYVHTNFGGSGEAGDYTAARAPANNTEIPATQKDTSGFTVLNGDGEQIYPTPKVAGGIDLVGDTYTASGANATPRRDKNPLDCASTGGTVNGHGSHVAGSAGGYGVNADGTTYEGPWDSSTPFDSLRIGPGSAPEATLYAIRVFGCSGATGVTVQAIDWAVDPDGDGDPSDRLDVINLSLGSSYGTHIDPSATAANVAAAAGVVPVISSGNSGDAYYVVGSPSSAARALSVANIADDTDVTDGFEVKAPASIAGTYGASRNTLYNWANPTSPPATALVPFEAPLYYPATNQYGCSTNAPANPTTVAQTGWSAEDLANISGKIVLVDWKKPGDATFPCGSANRANTATLAGAVGVIMVDTTPYLDTAIAGNAQIPSMYSTSLVGNALKSQLTPGVPSSIVVRLSHEYSNSTKLTTPGRADTVATSTSRGIRGPDNGLKPDISAPGSGIFSTDSGTGNKGSSKGGTSMAAPHMSGVLALLRQQHPSWSVEHLKALAMNTANHDLFTGLGQTGNRYGPARVGAGRVDVPEALTSESVAMADGGSGAVGVSFGAVEVLSTLSAERTVRVHNHGASAQSYSIAFDELTSIPGVSYSFPDGTSLNVPAGSSATFRIQLNANADAMRHTHDPTISETQTSNGPVFPRQWVSEASGLIKLTPTSGPTLRVPVHATARPISNMNASQGSVKLFGENATSNVIALAGKGLNTGTNEPFDIVSRVTALELSAVSGQATLPAGFPAHTRHADISHVGVASDVKAGLAATPVRPAHQSLIVFGLGTHANWATAATEANFTIQIDTDNDNAADYNVVNTRLVNGPNSDPQDIYVGARTKLAAPGAGTVLTDFLNYAFLEDTGLFNSNVMVIPVYANQLGYTATSTSTTFKYRVLGSSRFWGQVDAVPSATGWLTYNFAAPGLDFSGGAIGSPIYPDLAESTIPVNFDSAAYAANNSQGVLLLHHLNGNGKRAEVVQVQTDPGKPPKKDK